MRVCGRRRLGKGGCGQVYKGVDEDGRELAIKILHYEGVSDVQKAELMRHMAREVRFLQRVTSPYIVKLLGVQKVDSGQLSQSPQAGGRVGTEGVCALAYEYCRLGSLEDALQCRGEWNRRPTSGTQRFEILYQACIGLLELHSQDILHLDFKPANVLLDGPLGPERDTSTVSARIGDFGMAKKVHQLTSAQGASGNTITISTRTNRTQLWVTEGYACPEYIQTKRGSDRTDVYAMGITIFRVVTGKHPSGSGGVTLKTSIEKALRHGSPADVAKRVEQLCEPVAQWCARASLMLLKLGLRCVANVPEERPSIEEVFLQLGAIRDPNTPNLADSDSSSAPVPDAVKEEDEGEEVTLTINVARQRIKLKAQSCWDLEDIRTEILRQHKAKGFRNKDIDQFYLNGTLLPESLTIQELMSPQHQPSLNPAVDTIHAIERGSAMLQNQPTSMPQREDDPQLETGARVRIHSLQSTNGQKYNGKEGVLGARHEDQRRWYVTVSGATINCKPENLEFLKPPKRSSEDAVEKALQKHRAILTHAAFASASQTSLPFEHRSHASEVAEAISMKVKDWERAGKGSSRKNIAAALRQIMGGESDIARLRPRHPPWTRVEEACVQKVLEYRSMPYENLLKQAAATTDGLDNFVESESDAEDAPGTDEDIEETSEEMSGKPNWEKLFVRFKKFWRRLARIAALQATNGDALVEVEHEFFKETIDDLESCGWEIRKPIERILLRGVRELQHCAWDSDRNSKNQIERLLKWIREEEKKIAELGDRGLFSIDDAGIDDSEGEEAAQAVRYYDRVCQLLAWLALEPKSEQRDALRRTVVDKLGPYLEERNIFLLSVAQNLWVLADSDGGINMAALDSQAQQVGANPTHPRPRPRAAARKQAPTDNSDLMPVTFKGSDVRDSGRVQMLEETVPSDGNAAEERESGDGDDRTPTEDAVTRALTRRLHEYLRAGTGGIARKRAAYNQEVLTTLATKSEEWDPTATLGIKQAEKHAGNTITRFDGSAKD